MKRDIIITADVSTTIHLPDWDEQYHSKHGAIQEAYHVFIRKGLDLFEGQVAVLEIGFGTGLNALITLIESNQRNLVLNYTGVEAYPVAESEVKQLNYIALLGAQQYAALFSKIHGLSWGEQHSISPNFKLTKCQQFFTDIKEKSCYDLIYFDAFGARVQPELWTELVFEIMYNALKNNGVLVTYAAKGSVRRAMQAVGFSVERLPGPPGKREMLRATKTLE